MGTFFDELFNKNNSDMTFSHIVSEENVIGVSIEDPEYIVSDYFQLIKEANSIDEVKSILMALFEEGIRHAIKEAAIDEIRYNIEILRELEEEYNDQESDDL